MIQILKELFPVARKEHRCMFCGGKIPVGERYRRTTNLYDGDLYDWVCHEDCFKVSHLLDMYDTDADGVDDCAFQENLDDYLRENYFDKTIDDIREDVDKMSRIEQVRLVIADWDKPFIKVRRLKYEIARVRRYLSYSNNERSRERLQKLEAELEETEKQL